METMTSRERYLAAIQGTPYDRPPVQPMQITFAARHSGIPFGRAVLDGELFAEAQLKTMRDFDTDIILLCSDPAREVVDMAGEGSVIFFDDQPPAIDEHNAALADKSNISKLRKPDPAHSGRMYDRVRSIDLLRRKAGPDAVIIGWVEGALALAAELRGINNLMMDFIEDPDFADELLSLCADVAIDYGRIQLEHGADSIGMSDAAASMISPKLYERHLWPLQRRVLTSIKSNGGLTRLHMCGRTNQHMELMEQLPVDVYEMDFMTDIEHARRILGPDRAITGNVHTIKTMFEAAPEDVIRECARCHKICGPRYIVSPGCDIPPGTPEANFAAMVEYSRHWREYCI
jgi:MtaA/CmuA family methyltransferase